MIEFVKVVRLIQGLIVFDSLKYRLTKLVTRLSSEVPEIGIESFQYWSSCGSKDNKSVIGGVLSSTMDLKTSLCSPALSLAFACK